jgi:hypothetical protein
MSRPIAWLSVPVSRIGDVAKKVWTAEELEKMTPAEQDELFASSIVRDLDAAPPHLVERAREDVLKRLEAEDANPA